MSKPHETDARKYFHCCCEVRRCLHSVLVAKSVSIVQCSSEFRAGAPLATPSWTSSEDRVCRRRLRGRGALAPNLPACGDWFLNSAFYMPACRSFQRPCLPPVPRSANKTTTPYSGASVQRRRRRRRPYLPGTETLPTAS